MVGDDGKVDLDLRTRRALVQTAYEAMGNIRAPSRLGPPHTPSEIEDADSASEWGYLAKRMRKDNLRLRAAHRCLTLALEGVV